MDLHTGALFPILILINVGVMVGVYYDASTESRRSQVFWPLVVFFLGFVFGLLLYYLLGPPRARRKRLMDDSDGPMNVDRSGPF